MKQRGVGTAIVCHNSRFYHWIVALARRCLGNSEGKFYNKERYEMLRCSIEQFSTRLRKRCMKLKLSLSNAC
jgi:hypothetical protein